MAAPLLNVYSSFVAQIGYDADTRQLHVVYGNNGRRGVYFDVPPEIAEHVLPHNAPSIGQALHTYIRSRFTFRYLDERTDEQ